MSIFSLLFMLLDLQRLLFFYLPLYLSSYYVYCYSPNHQGKFLFSENQLAVNLVLILEDVRS